MTDSLWEEYAGVDAVDVSLDLDVPDLQPAYTYRVPESLRNAVEIGSCVHVPFAGREALGYALERRVVPADAPMAARLKDVIAVVEGAAAISAELVDLARWMSDRYVCDLLTAIRCIVPSTLTSRVTTRIRLTDIDVRTADIGASVAQAHVVEILRSLGGAADLEVLRSTANLPGLAAAISALERKGVVHGTREIARPAAIERMVRAYSLGAAAEQLDASNGRQRQSAQQQRVLAALVQFAREGRPSVPAPLLARAAEVGPTVLRTLARKGMVEERLLRVRRSAIDLIGPATRAPDLTAAQRAAAGRLRELLDARQSQTVLLFGVTASGKTEVYLDAIACALSQGRTALVLVPEIALTSQVVDTFVGRFGDRVALFHSRLSDGERCDEWNRIRRGEARIVVGARSAVFAPLPDIGLVVLDEEHETSYKQENAPRYNAREVAAERARRSGAVLVLGSATPSVETFYRSGAEPGLHVAGNAAADAPESCEPPSGPAAVLRLTLPERVYSRPLPHVTVVDLREEYRVRRALFSQRLEDAMSLRLRAGKQTILFLNRRGYAQFVLCRDCGYTAKCPNCAVSLAFHSYARLLRCHHCDYTNPVPATCPDCGGMKLRAFGIGTEKVEEEVIRLFPDARVARMDRDTTARKGAHTALVRSFRSGEADILIGTQMVAKGLDFPNVTLVGVVSADTAINMPDFRAAERTFQLLTQVAGRAGRGADTGEVVIQTFSPDHYAVQAAVRHDYLAFYDKEILFRRELRYPPFSRFVNMIVFDADERAADARSARLAAALIAACPTEVEVIGPAAAPLSRLKTLYRFHVALRAPVGAALSAMVRSALQSLSPSDRYGIAIDMDPLSMV